MADYLADFVPEWVEKEEPREIILKLGKMITNRIPVKLGFQKLTKYDPEYWGLSLLLTDEMAEVAMKMEVRKPKTLPELVKLTGMRKKNSLASWMRCPSAALSSTTGRTPPVPSSGCCPCSSPAAPSSPT